MGIAFVRSIVVVLSNSVSTFATRGSHSRVNRPIRERLAIGIADFKSTGYLFDGPGWGESAFGHSIELTNKIAPTEADALGSVVGVSMPLTANVPCTPHRAPANVATGGGRHAATIDIVHTRAACLADLRDHAVRLMKRHGRHGLHGCCQGQGKSNSN